MKTKVAVFELNEITENFIKLSNEFQGIQIVKILSDENFSGISYNGIPVVHPSMILESPSDIDVIVSSSQSSWDEELSKKFSIVNLESEHIGELLEILNFTKI